LAQKIIYAFFPPPLCYIGREGGLTENAAALADLKPQRSSSGRLPRQNSKGNFGGAPAVFPNTQGQPAHFKFRLA
jgi:hypothetical protein